MRMIFALVLLVGLGLAGFAVYMAQGFIERTRQENALLLEAQQKAPKLVDVVVSKKPFKYGDRMTQQDFEVVKWQEGKVPEGAFNAITGPQGNADPLVKPLFFDGETRPRAALRSLEPFEPVLAA